VRTAWMLAGILGFSAAAAASPNLQFQTVINQGDSIGGDQFDDAGQVVAGPNGTVGIVALLESGNPIVIYSTPGAGNTWNNQAVAVAGDSYNIPPIGSDEQFDYFDNLAITGNPSSGTRLTFAAEDVSGNEGIIQSDTGSSSLGDVAFEGDTKGYTSIGSVGTDSGSGTLEMQVNGNGQVLFPAMHSTTSVIVRGDDSSSPSSPNYVTTIFTSNGSLSNAGDPGSRVALGADNSGAALLTASGASGVYSIPANGSTPTKISGSFTPSTEADPVMGYASGNGVNAALMLVNGTSSGTQNIVLEKNSGTPQSILSQQFTIPAGEAPPQGQITPNGQIAVYVPSTVGDTIQYLNATASSYSAAVVASVYPSSGPVPNSALALDPTGSTLKIEGLTSPGQSGPEINSNGAIVFDAEVGTSPSNEKQALLDWLPGDQSPEILLAAGDTVVVGGQPVTIDDFLLNDLSNDYDYYKNAFNDQNGLAVAVDYTTASDASGSAVLFAEVPEPSTIALVSIVSLGLLARRRRS